MEYLALELMLINFYSFPEVSDIILSSAMKGLDNAIYDVAASFCWRNFLQVVVYIMVSLPIVVLELHLITITKA